MKSVLGVESRTGHTYVFSSFVGLTIDVCTVGSGENINLQNQLTY
jgi:hypothetical protein